MHEPLSNLRPVIFVQYAQGTARTEVWRGLHGAATFQPRCGKIVIGVSEDIDPANTDAVFWSIAYRSNPLEDVHLMPYGGGVQGAQYGPNRQDSIMLIDATLKRPMPPFALPAREFMEGARAIWQELGLPAINAHPPWHGYTLGNWSERWATMRAAPSQAPGRRPAPRPSPSAARATSCRNRPTAPARRT